MDGSTSWLPISEAAPRLGLTVDGLRSRIRRGLVTPKKGNDGRLLVAVSTDSPATGHEPVMDTSSPVTDHGEADELRAEVLELRVAVARLEAQVQAAGSVRAAIEAKAQAAVDAATLATRAEVEAMRVQVSTQIAARNVVIEELRAGLDHERARSEALAHELAEARKGWLERLLEAVRRRP